MKIIVNTPNPAATASVGDVFADLSTPKLYLRASYDNWITFDPRDGRIWCTKSIPPARMGARIPCAEITVRGNT